MSCAPTLGSVHGRARGPPAPAQDTPKSDLVCGVTLRFSYRAQTMIKLEYKRRRKKPTIKHSLTAHGPCCSPG